MPKDKTSYNTTLDFLNSMLKYASVEKPITDLDLRESDLEAINSHNKTYTTYLESYVYEFKRKSSAQRTMKSWFFIIVMFLLAIIIIASFTSLIIISLKRVIGIEEIATLLTAIGSALAAFLILPKIIATNLFPSKEEDKTDIIFNKMFDYDMNLRDLYCRRDLKTTELTSTDIESTDELESV